VTVMVVHLKEEGIVLPVCGSQMTVQKKE